MSDFNKFKKFSSGESEAPKNPYTKGNTIQPSNEDGGNILKQNNYLFSQLKLVEREVKELREDIASLYQMMFNSNDISILTKEEVYEMYLKFKMDPRHIINRKKINE